MIINKQPNTKRKKILFHYTSIGSLMKILDNVKNEKVCIRATHAKYFNDPFEYKHAISLFKTSMVRYEKENKIKNKKSTHFNNKFLSSLSMFSGHPYILSFSEHVDDLNMWRTYGSNGNGVAIGLDLTMLEEYVKDTNNTDSKLLKCQYEEDLIIKELKLYLKPLYKRLYFRKGHFYIDQETFRIILDISNFCFSFKRPEFSSENEWRLCRTLSDLKNVKFYERNGIIIPFIEHMFPLDIIKKIIVGPCANKQLVGESILMLTKSRNFKLPSESVIISKVPYRNI